MSATSGPADRTTLIALTANLDIGDTADPALRLAYFQYMTDLSDANYAYLQSLVTSGTLSPMPPDFMQRQAIINGNFNIASTGTSFTNPASSSITLDRYKVADAPDGGTNPTVIHSQNQITAGSVDGSFYCYNINSNGFGSGFGANTQHAIEQRIENGTRLLAGLDKTITISFYAKSTITGKRIGVFLSQLYGTGGTPSASENITGTNWTLTSTWTKYTFTFTTNTLVGKTFGTNNDDFLITRFYDTWGTSVASRVGATTAETFGGSGDVSIAQFQVNAGDIALPFQPKTIQDESIACSRFNQRISGSTFTVFGLGMSISTVTTTVFVPLSLKRILPTLTNGGNFRLLQGSTSIAVTSITLDTTTSSTDRITLNVGVASGLTVGSLVSLQANNDVSAYLNFNAEL